MKKLNNLVKKPNLSYKPLSPPPKPPSLSRVPSPSSKIDFEPSKTTIISAILLINVII